MSNHRTFIVNLFGGPGSGKSTTAAQLFAGMKQHGVSCELVTEYAKELTWANDRVGLLDSLDILAEQCLRLQRLVGKVDYVITDSPLPVIAIYASNQFATNWFDNTVMQTWSLFNNLNFRIDRCKPYDPEGRTQTESEALTVDYVIDHLAIYWSLRLKGDEHAALRIAKLLEESHHALRDALSRAAADVVFGSDGRGAATQADVERVFGPADGLGTQGQGD